MDPDALLADLDADQRRAVTTESRLVAVIAGAGSGKTRVLTRRVAYRIATETADASHTAVLTFTREAAGELRRRLPRLGLTDRVTAGTFHAVSQSLLRQLWADRDQPPRTILTERSRVVGDVTGRPSDLAEIVAEIDWASARGLSPEGYLAAVRRGDRRGTTRPERVAEAMIGYRAEKRKRRVVDLDDLLSLTIEAFERDQEFADSVRWRFRHVLVDEAQDLNPLQHRLVDLLRRDRDDLFLVGDPSQAIFGFNGSDPTLLVDVHDRFPGIEVVRLPVNHRCTPQIVDAGSHTLRADGQPADVVSARPDGAVVAIREHADEQVEAAWVARRVALLDPTLVRGGDVAVLARTHAALAPTRRALEAERVAVRRDVDGAGSPLAAMLREAYRIADPNRMRRWAQDLAEHAAAPLDVAGTTATAVDDDERPAPLLPREVDPRREAATAALEFLREQPTGDGRAFRAWVAANDPFGGDLPGVELLTFHAAKGREWHTVFIVGCETGLVPHRSATTNVARAEEARLLYVALTRATDVLVVNWAARRAGYQRRRSPLLDGFSSDAPSPAPPPAGLVDGMPRPPRSVALDRLREWRATVARAGGILPDAVCSDRALAAIAECRPSTPEELDRITGLGAITALRLFDGIRAALADAPPATRVV